MHKIEVRVFKLATKTEPEQHIVNFDCSVELSELKRVIDSIETELELTLNTHDSLDCATVQRTYSSKSGYYDIVASAKMIKDYNDLISEELGR